MGIKTYIHLHIESKGRDSLSWKHYAKMQPPYISKLLSLFNRRDPFSDQYKKLPQLNGIPEDATYQTLKDYTLFVDDQLRHPESITSKKAQELVDELISVPVKARQLYLYERQGISFVSKPEWHYSHSLSCIELLSIMSAVFGYENLNNKEKLGAWWSVKDIMTFHDRSGRDSRVIFWFSYKHYDESLRESLLHLRFPPNFPNQ